jgi:hypothetical protein
VEALHTHARGLASSAEWIGTVWLADA